MKVKYFAEFQVKTESDAFSWIRLSNNNNLLSSPIFAKNQCKVFLERHPEAKETHNFRVVLDDERQTILCLSFAPHGSRVRWIRSENSHV